MKVASLRIKPSEPVFLVRSDPAKSIKWSFEYATLSYDSTLDLLST
jgi:hypothetical protein